MSVCAFARVYICVYLIISPQDNVDKREPTPNVLFGFLVFILELSHILGFNKVDRKKKSIKRKDKYFAIIFTCRAVVSMGPQTIKS